MQQVNLEIKRGDSKSYTLTFKDDDGALIDITDWTIFFTAKETVTDTDANAKISKDITSHTDPTNGETQIQLSPADTALTPGNYVYDIQIKKNTGEINTIVEGTLTITKDVTQRTS